MEACAIEQLPNNTVLISINEQTEPLHRLKLDRLDSRILTLRFSDVTSSTTFGDPISDSDSLEIINFVERNAGKDIIVHCHAGVSRSAAIVLFLHLIHEYDLPKDFWLRAHPNKYVLGQLMVTHTYKNRKEKS